MDLLDNFTSEDEYTFILAPNHDERSMTCFKKIITNISVKNIVEINYPGCTFDEKTKSKYDNIITSVSFANNLDFIISLKNLDADLFKNNIIVDITGLNIPEMFSLLKFLKSFIKKSDIKVVYSMPYDYIFKKEPFTSYQSYDGYLELCEPIGFSGTSSDDDNKSLFLFMGFEGVLSLKVIEEFQYDNRYLVNNLPSFYSKYKDISVLNNYDVIDENEKIYFTSADNPFETYNFIESMVKENTSICIAPLSTKPVALGTCLYALNNSNVRIVYPVSSSYKKHNSVDSYKSYVYTIPLLNLN